MQLPVRDWKYIHIQHSIEGWNNSPFPMKKYIGKIKGEFEETQSVIANSPEEAHQLLEANAGETIDRTATELLEVSDIQEVE